MPQVTLTFNLPEDKQLLACALKGQDLAFAVSAFAENMRRASKDSDDRKRIDALDWGRAEMQDQLDAYHIDLEDLLE